MAIAHIRGLLSGSNGAGASPRRDVCNVTAPFWIVIRGPPQNRSLAPGSQIPHAVPVSVADVSLREKKIEGAFIFSVSAMVATMHVETFRA